MLYSPNVPSKVFEPTPRFFLRYFDIYDREETLGEELAQYDPMKYEDLESLMYKYFVIELSYEKYTNAHKKALLKSLKESLDNPSFNFNELVEDDHDECFSFPWEISDARKFFTNIYKIISKYWGDLEVKE